MGQIGLTNVPCTRANRDAHKAVPSLRSCVCDGCVCYSLTVLPPHCEDTMDRRWGRWGGGSPLLSSTFRCSEGGRGRAAWAETVADCVVGGVGSPTTCGESAWISWHAPFLPRTRHHVLFHLSPPPPLRGRRDEQSVRDDRNKQQTDRPTDRRAEERFSH